LFGGRGGAWWGARVGAKRVLVTGASGFIGRPLVRALVHAGYTVRAATRRPVSFPDSIDVAIVPDFSAQIDWKPILRGMDVVVHVAGLAHADSPDEAFGVFDRVNWIATQELARAAARASVGHFVYISSVRAQTGPSATRVVREEDEAHPTDHYGRSKLAAESAVRASGVPFTIMRPVVVYGAHPKGNFKSVLRLAKSPWPLPVGGLNCRRSLLGIDNLLSAILSVLNNPAALGETYLVADPKPVTIRELFTILREAQGRRPWLINVPQKLFRLALMLMNRSHLWERLGDELVVDTTKLEALGWRPAVETYDGLRAALSTENGEVLLEGPSTQALKKNLVLPLPGQLIHVTRL
jgi:UDP-glucose 4-epimerase